MIKELEIPNFAFSDIWNHSRHFLVVERDTNIRIHGNIIIRELEESGKPSGREMLCAITYMDSEATGIRDGFCVISIDILQTTSEYANRYGNCSVFMEDRYRNSLVVKEE